MKRKTYYAVYEDVLTRMVLQFQTYQDREDWLTSPRSRSQRTSTRERISAHDPEVRRAVRALDTVWCPHYSDGFYRKHWPFGSY